MLTATFSLCAFLPFLLWRDDTAILGEKIYKTESEREFEPSVLGFFFPIVNFLSFWIFLCLPPKLSSKQPMLLLFGFHSPGFSNVYMMLLPKLSSHAQPCLLSSPCCPFPAMVPFCAIANSQSSRASNTSVCPTHQQPQHIRLSVLFAGNAGLNALLVCFLQIYKGFQIS